jgi:hypothetical protein
MDNAASSASSTTWLQTPRAASIRLMFVRNARNVSSTNDETLAKLRYVRAAVA